MNRVDRVLSMNFSDKEARDNAIRQVIRQERAAARLEVVLSADLGEQNDSKLAELVDKLNAPDLL